ncbi:hypothetical protein Cgig2_024085 [Carnegiea gigantea]|uniref:Uncharacterized protein n=1 Tax=Carnegiea gigantea TaxID=171969 RepID=A0A9Q1K7I2_9CARY|nr:hypothetical protein Cgig2_024085 [Carnegiea gigantea]
MGIEEVRRMVSKVTDNDLTVQKLWYSLKYDRGWGLTSICIFIWVRVMGRRGTRRRQVHQMKGERGAVNEPEQKFEQLDETNTPHARAMACEWPLEEASEEDRKAQAGHPEVKKWCGGRIEQKLADAYKKMGCIVVMECYSLMLGEYNVELTNNRKLVMKLGQQTCTCK